MDKIGLYAGSFDPVTNGHLDIIVRASALFDHLYVVVMKNSSKNYTFSFQEKFTLLKQVVEENNLTNVTVKLVDNQLVTQVAKQVSAHWLVRGVRTAADVNYEISMQQINKLQQPDLETVYLISSPQYMYLSSSMVKEVAQYGGNIKGLVPEVVELALKSKLGKFHE